jgi:DMSO/TMAO reductase YedYZ molybdopterin-dependent catalytic subunit
VLALVILGVVGGGCGSGRVSTTLAPLAGADASAPGTATPTVTRTVRPAPPTGAEKEALEGSTTTLANGATTTAGTGTTTTARATTTLRGTTNTTKKATTTSQAPPTTARGDVVLEVAGPSDTRDFSMTELKALPATEGWGGWKNQFGNITAPMQWRGVSVRALMDLVGGGNSIVAVASDGYEQSFSGAEINGDVPMYNPSSGDAVSSISGTLSIIIAYSQGGAAIGSAQGPVRIALVSPQKDQVTDGTSWVKWVVKIKVNP